MLRKTQGFTLIELLIALVIASFLLLGVTGTYSSLQSSIQTSKDLENAQEVLRFTSSVFTRSLKQTSNPVNSPATNILIVQQSANTPSCIGFQPPVDYMETFTFAAPDLLCSLSDIAGNVLAPDTQLLTNIDDLSFAINPAGDLITITVQPDGLPASVGDNVAIDIALTSIIIP